jgi:hypothetical protein
VTRLFERRTKAPLAPRLRALDDRRDPQPVQRSGAPDGSADQGTPSPICSSPKEALRIAQDNLDSYGKTVELSKARLDAGDISKTDFERIDLQLAEFESDYDNAKLDLTQAERFTCSC